MESTNKDAPLNLEARNSAANITSIAVVCHEAIRAFNEQNGLNSLPHWEEATTMQQDSSIEAVKFQIENPEGTPGMAHDRWMNERFKQGWTLGDERNDVEKTNPALVPFEELPKVEQQKDALIIAIVNALR